MTAEDIVYRMAVRLLPYDRAAACDKCGHAPALTEFHEEMNAGLGYNGYSMSESPEMTAIRACATAITGSSRPTRVALAEPVHFNEDGKYGPPTTYTHEFRWLWPAHLHRTCPNCRWEWVEAPVDATHIFPRRGH